MTQINGLHNMTTEELKDLKKQWYEEAQKDGSLARCHKVCTVLGKSLEVRYGPKYLFSDDESGLELYVDGWGNFFTAEWKGKRVMSTHPCDQLFIPGDWMEIVNRLYPTAIEKAMKKEEHREEMRRRQMVAELSL